MRKVAKSKEQHGTKVGVNEGEVSKLQRKAGSDIRLATLNGTSGNVKKSDANEGFKVDSVASLMENIVSSSGSGSSVSCSKRKSNQS